MTKYIEPDASDISGSEESSSGDEESGSDEENDEEWYYNWKILHRFYWIVYLYMSNTKDTYIIYIHKR